jgi:hypothetical protein
MSHHILNSMDVRIIFYDIIIRTKASHNILVKVLIKNIKSRTSRYIDLDIRIMDVDMNTLDPDACIEFKKYSQKEFFAFEVARPHSIPSLSQEIILENLKSQTTAAKTRLVKTQSKVNRVINLSELEKC